MVFIITVLLSLFSLLLSPNTHIWTHRHTHIYRQTYRHSITSPSAIDITGRAELNISKIIQLLIIYIMKNTKLLNSTTYQPNLYHWCSGGGSCSKVGGVFKLQNTFCMEKNYIPMEWQQKLGGLSPPSPPPYSAAYALMRCVILVEVWIVLEWYRIQPLTLPWSTYNSVKNWSVILWTLVMIYCSII